MKSKNSGFTLVEVLMAVTIIAILVALLIPSLSMVRRIAKETAQKAQFATIDMALGAFKNDFGDYPPSNWLAGSNYCGAQKLAEALAGWDLLGFHPRSEWRSDGLETRSGSPNGEWAYDPCNIRLGASLNERRGPYLELATANVFKLGDLFGWKPGDTGPLDNKTFVMCDMFKVKRITLVPAPGRPTSVIAGTPILYYKANTSSKTITLPKWDDNIYSINDNLGLITLGVFTDKPLRDWRRHPLAKNIRHLYDFDYEGGIKDPKIKIPWPYRPDSYILISAGADGLYGTTDDIHNF